MNGTDWNDGSVDERLGTIAQIENFVGGPVGTAGGTGATLEPEDAYDLMDGHTRSAAFGGAQLSPASVF